MEIPDSRKAEKECVTAGCHGKVPAGILTTVIKPVAETVDSVRESRRRKFTKNLP
jgi:hypothetical protein